MVLFDLLSCRNVCATEYAEVCEERVATRLGEFLALVNLIIHKMYPSSPICNWCC